jgi:hypothetical protein
VGNVSNCKVHFHSNRILVFFYTLFYSKLPATELVETIVKVFLQLNCILSVDIQQQIVFRKYIEIPILMIFNAGKLVYFLN